MSKSTAKGRQNKPAKPHKDYPLFAHANGQWAKKVKGRLHYFGGWDDPQAALQKWLDEKDDWLGGRTPRSRNDGMTIKDIADRFLTGKLDRVDSGELSTDSYRDYVYILQKVADVLGKHRMAESLGPDEFTRLRKAFAETHGPVRLTKDVTVTRMLFRWAHDCGLIETPVRFGPDFKPPTRKTRLKATRANGKKDFDAAELRFIIDAADSPLKAMILLGINAGLGQSDIANLCHSHIDGEWLNYPRPKTEAERRCPLWPETLEAIQDAAKRRGRHKNDADADCIFITRNGNRWVRNTANDDPGKSTRVDTVAANFSKLLRGLGINGKRGFYSLRHTFETQTGESRDQVAVDRVMGHSDQSMGARYRHGISDDRLRDVVNVVRGWLWPDDNE